MSGADAVAELVVRVVTDTSKAKGLDDTAAKTSKFSKGVAAASKVAAGALVAIGGAAIGAAKAAAEDAASQDALAQAMKKNAGASSAQIAATEDWIDAQSRATGVTDDELRPALGNLVRATGDVQKSQKALAVAMDVSAATGKPLSAVSAALAKGFGGSATSLGKLVPGLDKAALKSADMGKIMDELKAKTGGAAKAAGETAAGKMKRFQVALGETQESIGAVLLPALMKLSTILVTVGQWAQDHGTLFAIIAGGVAVLAAAVIALNVAMSIYNTITAVTAVVSGAAWAATLGPILLVVAAVAAVVAIIIILWKKSSTFRAIVLGTWKAIQAAARATANALKAVWRGVWTALSAYVRIYVVAFRVAFAVIRTIAKAVGDFVRTVWRAVWSALAGFVRAYVSTFRTIFSGIREFARAIADGVRSAWQTVFSALERAARGITSVLTKPFDVLHDAIDGVIRAVESLIGWLSRIHVPKISLPKVPGLGRSALAAPSPTGLGVGTYAAPSAYGLGLRAAGATSSGATYSIAINGLVHDPEGTARALGRILDNHERRMARRAA